MKVNVTETDKNNIIARTVIHFYKIKCNFDRRLNVSNAQVIEVGDRKEDFQVLSRTNFTAVMNVYTDNVYTSIAKPPIQVKLLFKL